MKRSPKSVNPAKKKTKTKAQLQKECLALWSLCIRTKQRKCRICGSDYRLQAHHIRSVKNHATMLDLENGMCLCARCHCLQRFSPEKFQDNVLEVIGQAEYDRLKDKSLSLFKYTMKDLDMMRTYLKGRLKSLESDYGTLKQGE